MARKKPVGWRKEPGRHGLAAKGIKTGRKKYDESKYRLGRMILEPMIVRNIQEDFPDQRVTTENAQKEVASVIREAFIQSGRMPASGSIRMEDKFYRYLVKGGKGKIEGRFKVTDRDEKVAVGVVIAKVKNSQIVRMKIWIGPGPKRFESSFEETFAKELAQIREEA